MERWKGRLALVTGASAGIGAAIAVALANHGMKVVGCARSVQKIEDLRKRVKCKKGSIIAVRCDLRKESDMMAVIDVCKKNGGIDVCINNAGIVNNSPLLSGKTEEWREMMDINIISLSIFTREAFKSMRERNVNDGHIIQISSWGGHVVMDVPSGNFYTGTKHMVRALLLGLRNEVRATGTNIRVSEISPGATESNMVTRTFGEQAEKGMKTVLKRLKADDLANAAVHILQQPPHAEVYEVILLPTEQYDTATAVGVNQQFKK